MVWKVKKIAPSFIFGLIFLVITMAATAADTTPRVVIGDPERFAEKKKKFALGGKDALQVLFSFLVASHTLDTFFFFGRSLLILT